MQIVSELIIDENGVAFHPALGNSYQLNEVSQKIIELLKLNYSKEQIMQELLKEYDVSENELFVDLNDFLAKLKLYGLYL